MRTDNELQRFDAFVSPLLLLLRYVVNICFYAHTYIHIGNSSYLYTRVCLCVASAGSVYMNLALWLLRFMLYFCCCLNLYNRYCYCWFELLFHSYTGMQWQQCHLQQPGQAVQTQHLYEFLRKEEEEEKKRSQQLFGLLDFLLFL